MLAGRCALAAVEPARTATPVAATTAHVRARREIPFILPPLVGLEPSEASDNPMRRLVELWAESQCPFAAQPRKTSRIDSTPPTTIAAASVQSGHGRPGPATIRGA